MARRPRAVVRALGALLLAACTVKTDDADGTAVQRMASSAGAEQAADSASDAAADTVPRPSRATTTHDTTVSAAAAPWPRDTLVALGAAKERDTSAVAPTAADLAALQPQLVVPVDGVPADALHDTFSEARGTRVHQALDIPAPRGTAVLSAAPGRVLRLFDSENGGLMVYAADSTERFVLLYGHLDAYAPGLVEGAPLRRGQVIGTVGTTGNAPPNVPHLHFAIARTRNVAQWWTGTPLDPLPLLRR